MPVNRNGFAAMLLTVPLSPDREEFSRPLTPGEYQELIYRLQHLEMNGPGELLDMNIAQLMHTAGLTEEEAFRIYTLINRSVQMNYAVESFLAKGIRIVSCYDSGYPAPWKKKGELLPPVCFVCGNPGLANTPCISIISIGGVKTTPEKRHAVEHLVHQCAERGYTVITGGEAGISTVAAKAVAGCGGNLIEVLAGEMDQALLKEPVRKMLQEDRCAVYSMEHPQALTTVSHAIQRNKACFTLSDAVFIINGDGKRGEMEALNRRLCDWVYALEEPALRGLISRGAIPIGDLNAFDLRSASERWGSSRFEQLSMLDRM